MSNLHNNRGVSSSSGPQGVPCSDKAKCFLHTAPPGKDIPNRPDILIQHTHLHKSAPFSVPREYFFFRMQIGIQFHFPPLSAQPPPPSNFIWNDRVHLLSGISPGTSPQGKPCSEHRAILAPSPPRDSWRTWTPELHLKYLIISFDVGHLTIAIPRESPAQNIGPFLAIFCMSGLSEQGLPLDSREIRDPPNFVDARILTKIGGSRDPPVPRETPAQNNEGLLVLSSVPPGTASPWRPP